MTSLFDRRLLRRRRDRAAAGFADFDFIKQEACERLADRLRDITRTFPLAVDLGAHTGELGRALGDAGGIEQLVRTDVSWEMVKHIQSNSSPQGGSYAVVCDEEFLPFADNSLDLVLSAMNLHWVNDVPGMLIQIQRALKPDGLFLAVVPGAQTLRELREALTLAEMETLGGMSPRVAPFLEVRDAGNLLQRAGFALPVADSETLTVTYDNPLKLLKDLQGMGEANLLLERRRTPTPRRTLFRALELYRERYSNAEGRIPATVEFLTLTAWKPHESQQKPARRGSGKIHLEEALK